MLKFALLAWLPLPLLGIANGIVRQLFLAPFLGERIARPLSGLTLLLLITLYLILLRRHKCLNPSDAMRTGGLWLVLTVAFEFLFGYYVAGGSWRQLLSNYDVADGNLWLLVVLWVGLAPWILLSRWEPSGRSR